MVPRTVSRIFIGGGGRVPEKNFGRNTKINDPMNFFKESRERLGHSLDKYASRRSILGAE